MTGRRLLARLAAVVALAAAAGGCAYLNEKQGELIFRPTNAVWWG